MKTIKTRKFKIRKEKLKKWREEKKGIRGKQKYRLKSETIRK